MLCTYYSITMVATDNDTEDNEATSAGVAVSCCVLCCSTNISYVSQLGAVFVSWLWTQMLNNLLYYDDMVGFLLN